jgi:hypothetical protein
MFGNQWFDHSLGNANWEQPDTAPSQTERMLLLRNSNEWIG